MFALAERHLVDGVDLEEMRTIIEVQTTLCNVGIRVSETLLLNSFREGVVCSHRQVMHTNVVVHLHRVVPGVRVVESELVQVAGKLRERPVDIEQAKQLDALHPFTVIKRSLWRNREWSCVLWEGEHHLHIGIEHISQIPRHDWLAFQQIKNQLVGPDQEMVELYPADSRMVNCVNMYHLWGTIGVKIMLGWLPDVVGAQIQRTLQATNE